VSRSDRSSIAERLVATAAAFAVAAVAISFAVHVVESVFIPLAVIILLAALSAGAVTWFRRNSRGW
jgi:predicted PurR-regulated permease PerM